ncbi:MAG: hypothetical protein PVI11_07965 [Candidatus Aminicenantes bacterium]|jgi:hypothetical protein
MLHISLAGVLCLTVFLFSQEQKQKKNEEKPDPPSLIRMDLLVFEEKKLDPPKRNIFTPQSAGWQEPEGPGGLVERNLAGLKGAEAVAQEEPLVGSLGLRYIGYVKSGEKITALILFEGQALAVDEGEMIAEGVNVLKISIEEIEVVGQDQEPQKFPLEGETP